MTTYTYEDRWDDYESFTGLPDTDLGEALGEVLRPEYADADPEQLEDTLTDMVASLSPAEAFSVSKALSQIGRSARKIVSDPAFSQVATGLLPVAGGALGTVVGGPVGATVGTKLGAVAAKSLPKQPRTLPPSAAPKAPAAGGSAAATQGLVLTQHPDVLKGLLAAAMGEHGRKSINGIPVAALMSMLSSVFGKAAADADELDYLDSEADAENAAGASWFGDDESLYTALVDADNIEIAEAVGRP